MTLRPALLALAVSALAGCAGAAPPALPAADGALAPIVRVLAGRADTVDVSPGARFGAHPDVRVDALGGGRAVVTPRAGWSGVALVPFEGGGAGGVLAVEAVRPGGAGALRLRLVGPSADDPSLVEFAVSRADGAPVALDEEEGVVALVGDRPFGDNAVDAFADYVFLDLDAAGAGRQTVRLAVRAEGAVSDWLAVEVEGNRFARAVAPRVVGPPRPAR